jgi:hypothetical protein
LVIVAARDGGADEIVPSRPTDPDWGFGGNGAAACAWPTAPKATTNTNAVNDIERRNRFIN